MFFNYKLKANIPPDKVAGTYRKFTCVYDPTPKVFGKVGCNCHSMTDKNRQDKPQNGLSCLLFFS